MKIHKDSQTKYNRTSISLLSVSHPQEKDPHIDQIFMKNLLDYFVVYNPIPQQLLGVGTFLIPVIVGTNNISTSYRFACAGFTTT